MSIISFFTLVLSIGSLEENPQSNDAACPISSQCTLKVWVKWLAKESNPLNILYLLLKTVLFPDTSCVLQRVFLCPYVSVLQYFHLRPCRAVCSQIYLKHQGSIHPPCVSSWPRRNFLNIPGLLGVPGQGGGGSGSNFCSALEQSQLCCDFALLSPLCFYEASVFPFQTLLAYLFKVSFSCLTIKNIHNSRISFCQGKYMEKAMFIYLFIFCWHPLLG